MSTFVSVGNALQPFSRLLEGVSRFAVQLPQPVIVQHGHTPFSYRGCQAIPFLSMEEFLQSVQNAELLILHAGAGSIIHAVEARRFPVVMPRRAAQGEHVNDHQVELAQALAKHGKVVLADEPGDLMRAVQEALARQRQMPKPDKGKDANIIFPMASAVEVVLRDYADELSSKRTG